MLDNITNTNRYKDFFKQWNKKNSRVINGQFHASVSCKGKEYNQKQLLSIAKSSDLQPILDSLITS